MADSPKILPTIHVNTASDLIGISGTVGQKAIAYDTMAEFIYDSATWIDVPLRKLMGGGATPTVTLGTGAGVTATKSIEGDNVSGIITISTGTSLNTNTQFFKLTLADGVTFPGNMITHLSSIGANVIDVANVLNLVTMTSNSNTFNLKGVSLAPLTEYKLAYINTGYKK